MLTVEMTSIPASRSSSTSCQRFSLRDPGTFVCASSSTSDLVRLARQDRVDVHLLERRVRGTRCDPARNDLEIADLLRGVRSTVGLDEPDDDVGAALGSPAPFVEHRERLADAGCRSEVDTRASREPCGQPTASLDLIECHVELEHVDTRLAEEAERATVGVLVDELVDLRERDAAAPARPGAPGCGRWPPRCAGPGRKPEAVTASTGTSASFASPFSLR